MSGEPKKFHSVLVIDDHKMVVIGIKLLIMDRFRDFYQAGNGAAGIELAHQHQPDMVTKEIRLRCPGTRILGYSFNMDPVCVLEMVEAGIHGYVDKSGNDAEFI